MKPSKSTGILGYGVYIPIYRIKSEEIARIWGRSKTAVPIQEKSVPGLDEDSITFAVEASKNAIQRAGISPEEIEAVYVGSESPPYAVKPTATVVAEALGISPRLIAIDMEFACRAGTTAMQSIIGLVASDMVKYGLAIGTDTAQGRPRDELEYTAAAGAAAFIIAPYSPDNIAYIEGSYSYVTDTTDFWRRDGEVYPRHAYRFTGEPAYFHHIYEAARGLMGELGLKSSDFDYAVFHQPNVKFPVRIAKRLGFSMDKIKDGLLSNIIGNTYAASSMLGLAAVLDVAKPGERILVVSFGSGAGSDAFSIIVQDAIEEKRQLAPLVKDYIEKKKYIDYAIYVRYRGKIRMR